MDSDTLSSIGYRTESISNKFTQRGGNNNESKGLLGNLGDIFMGVMNGSSGYSSKLKDLRQDIINNNNKISHEEKRKVLEELETLRTVLQSNKINGVPLDLMNLKATPNAVNLSKPVLANSEKMPQELPPLAVGALGDPKDFLKSIGVKPIQETDHDSANTSEVFGMTDNTAARSALNSETSEAYGLTDATMTDRKPSRSASRMPTISETSASSVFIPKKTTNSVINKSTANDIFNTANLTSLGFNDTATSPKSGGNLSEMLNTSEFINSLINNYKGKSSKTGGSATTFGHRKLTTFSDFQLGGSEELSETSSDRDKKREQVDELHKETVQKIMEALGVSEKEAKVYKSYIYKKVKNDYPDLAYLERAIQMRKLADDVNMLKSISKDEISELSETLDRVRAEKEKKKSETTSMNLSSPTSSDLESLSSEKPKKKKAATKKSKKTTEVSETSFSATSY